MDRTKFGTLAIVVTVMMFCGIDAFVHPAGSGALIVDPCESTATGPAGIVFACPQRDGDALASLGLTITVICRDINRTPIPGIPATDIWLVSCGFVVSLCGGSGGLNASAPTDANGMTTITGIPAAGSCDLSGARVVVQGLVIGGYACGAPCVPINVISPDIDGNLIVDLSDFSTFAMDYPSPPKAFNQCFAFAPPYDQVALCAFARYAMHHGHRCF